MSRVTTKTVAGRALSNRPRPPPSASTNVVAETSPRGSLLTSSSGTGRTQLVRRVVDRGPTVLPGQSPVDDDGAARVDAADPPAAEPDQRDGAGSVVQLCFERRDTGARTQHDGPQRAGDTDRSTDRALRDVGRAGRGCLDSELPALELLLVGSQPRQRSPEATRLLLDLGHTTSVGQRVSVISGPRSGIDSPAGPSSSSATASASAAAAAADSATSFGRCSGSGSRTAIASPPRWTTTERRASSSPAATVPSVAAGPVMSARRNHLGPSTPRKRAGASIVPCPGTSVGTCACSSTPYGP